MIKILTGAAALVLGIILLAWPHPSDEPLTWDTEQTP